MGNPDGFYRATVVSVDKNRVVLRTDDDHYKIIRTSDEEEKKSGDSEIGNATTDTETKED